MEKEKKNQASTPKKRRMDHSNLKLDKKKKKQKQKSEQKKTKPRLYLSLWNQLCP